MLSLLGAPEEKLASLPQLSFKPQVFVSPPEKISQGKSEVELAKK